MKRYIIALSALITVSFIVFAFTARVFSSGKENELILPSEELEIIDFQGEMPLNAARCAIVIDAKTKNILFSQNADEKRGMASTTKIMTALIAIENGSLDSEYAIPKEAVGIEGSSVYLKEGEKLTLRELLYCLMLESGNDAATAIAIIVGQRLDSFVSMMNEKAQELGLTSTHFTNPHGLSDENHYTTARELAIITAEAMQYPLFREIVSTKTARVRYDGTENGRHLVNHNKLLFGYSGATGVKTGYTKRDGKCLVSSAEKDGMQIIAVTLQDPFPTATHKTLLDTAFSNHENLILAPSKSISAEVPIQDGEIAFLNVTNPLPAEILLPKNAKTEITLVLPETLAAPIAQGEIIGYAVCTASQKEVYVIHLESTTEIKVKKKTLIQLLFGK